MSWNTIVEQAFIAGWSGGVLAGAFLAEPIGRYIGRIFRRW